MRSQITNVQYKDKSFESIYNLLMENLQERQKFLKEPEKVVFQKGIKLNSMDMDIIKKLCNIRIDKNRMDFNEKLVLCSSSGY